MEKYLRETAAPAVAQAAGKWQLLDYAEDPSANTRTLRVLVNDKGECLHQVTRHPDGTITVNSGGNGEITPLLLHRGQFAKQLPNHINALLYLETTEKASHKGWIALSQLTWNQLGEVQDTLAEILEAATIPSNMPKTKGRRPPEQPTLETLTQRANNIIRTRLMDKENARKARELFPERDTSEPVPVQDYNEATLNGDILLQMERDNEPIIRLYKQNVLREAENLTPAGHPGEIIRRLKNHTGFTPRQWKQLHRLTAKCPDATRISYLGQLRHVTQAMADANRPEATGQKLRFILNLNQHAYFAEAGWTQGEPWKAWTQFLNQFLRHHDPEPDEHQVNRIIDALRAHIQHDLPWGPANWETLQLRSERWHQERIQNSRWKIPQEALRLHWESAMGETLIGKTKFTPVTDARRLVQLGNSMGNCLSTFWDRCKQGTSRIFTAHDAKDQKLLAAVELMSHSGIWTTGQIEGPARSSYPAHVDRDATQLARQYQSAHRET